MKIKTLKRYSRKTILLAFLFLSCLVPDTFAQPNITEVVVAETVLELCDGGCSDPVTALDVLNTDVMETGTLGDGELIKAVVWSGAVCSDINIIEQGLCVVGT